VYIILINWKIIPTNSDVLARLNKLFTWTC